jgi:hypothetical protein
MTRDEWPGRSGLLSSRHQIGRTTTSIEVPRQRTSETMHTPVLPRDGRQGRRRGESQWGYGATDSPLSCLRRVRYLARLSRRRHRLRCGRGHAVSARSPLPRSGASGRSASTPTARTWASTSSRRPSRGTTGPYSAPCVRSSTEHFPAAGRSSSASTTTHWASPKSARASQSPFGERSRKPRRHSEGATSPTGSPGRFPRRDRATYEAVHPPVLTGGLANLRDTGVRASTLAYDELRPCFLFGTCWA